MKIDGNSQVLRTVRLERNLQENAAGQAAAVADSQGAAFEKARNDLFVEQLERIQSGSGVEESIAGSPGMDAKSQLEILSGLTTERDLEELKKQTENLEEEDIEVLVTVVEKIKTQLAAYCDGFDSGMVEDLSDEKLEQLSGLTGAAVHVAKKLQERNLPITEENITGMLSAMEMLAKTELTEEAEEYCIKSNAELTIENLYMASHSGVYESGAGYYAQANGYYAKAGDEAAINALLPQIEQVITQAGLEVNDTTREQARWLLERQLPLTKENLLKMQEFDEIANQIDEEAVLEHMVDAMLEGKRPSQAELAGPTVLERSEQAVSVIQNATEEQVQEVVASGQELNIANLKQAEEEQNTNPNRTSVLGSEQNIPPEEMDIQLITARRQLEEIRLQMTIEASVTMIRQGISIETESLQNLIDRLKQMEEQYYHLLLEKGHIEPTAANIDLYKEITAVREGISQAPAEVVGSVAFTQTRVTIQAVYSKGAALEEKYKQAGQAYEAVMTRPRKDMGDSIQKAFRNVDDILEDLGMALTNENQRAVRILGYNSLEITQENIYRVKEADMEITSMIANMKPGTVLEMIRQGFNPLDKTAEEINQKIASMREEAGTGDENFSEFLWNLEHTDSISQEERSAYIGIYRLMHQIEHSDGAVVGALVEQGLSLTMRHLMTGIRSGRHKAMDYKIGESDGVEGSKKGSITEQIESGFGYEARLAGRIQNQMAGADLGAVPEPVMDMSMEEFTDCMQEQQAKEADRNGYIKEQLDLLTRASQTETEVLSFLQAKAQPVTISNTFASSALLKGRSGWFRDMKEYTQEEADGLEQELLESMDRVEEQFTDADSAQEAYGNLMDTAQKIVQQGTQDVQITYERMQSWKLISSQIHLASRLSESGDYHIPLEIGGELTSVHVQFVQNHGSQAKVAISFETGQTGKVAAEFVENNNTLEGYIIMDQKRARDQLESMDGMFRQQLEQAGGLPVGKMDYAEYGKLNLPKFAEKTARTGSAGVSSSELYQVAKAVLGFVKTAF